MEDTPELIDAALHEDDVRVVRHRVDRDYAVGQLPDDAFQDIEIEIPLRGEEVQVSKRPVVREVVIVSKVLEERTHPVNDRLRREEVHVHGDYIDDDVRDNRLERSRNSRMR